MVSALPQKQKRAAAESKDHGVEAPEDRDDSPGWS